MPFTYRWTKIYAVLCPAEDESEVGDEIQVESRNGASTQVVLSVTTMQDVRGRPYKALLVREVK